MCGCIKEIAKSGYIHADLFHANTYFIYPITWNVINGRGKVGKLGLLVNHCPVCGEKIDIGLNIEKEEVQ